MSIKEMVDRIVEARNNVYELSGSRLRMRVNSGTA